MDTETVLQKFRSNNGLTNVEEAFDQKKYSQAIYKKLETDINLKLRKSIKSQKPKKSKNAEIGEKICKKIYHRFDDFPDYFGRLFELWEIKQEGAEGKSISLFSNKKQKAWAEVEQNAPQVLAYIKYRAQIKEFHDALSEITNRSITDYLDNIQHEIIEEEDMF